MTHLLLVTCAALWLADDAPFAADARTAVETAASDHALWISPFSAWEMAVLIRKKRMPQIVSAIEWFDRLARRRDIRVATADAGILVESQSLPGGFHNDPADRFILATARKLNAAMGTRDKPMVAYAALGHVRVLPC